MASILLDTQALIWHLFDPGQLSTDADNAIQTAITSTADTASVSAISLVEIVYLINKSKLPVTHLTNIVNVIIDPTTRLQLLDVDLDIAVNLDYIPRKIVPDMPDRIIATTAYVHKIPLVTSDSQIQNAPITTIW